MVGCVVEEWAALGVLAQAFHARPAVSPASTSLLVLTLRPKESNSMNIWSCYDARPLGRASPPPDVNCPGIEAVMKRSDVQRGIEPVYQWRGDLYTCGGF
jgi:hypothetical protein